MNIAIISYEYPPETADGGIATYTYETARMLYALGHTVEVFAGSRTRDSSLNDCGVHVHRVCVADRWHFASSIINIFRERHGIRQFDIIEAPECMGDIRMLIQIFIDIPYVIRLHTPYSYILHMERTRDTDSRRNSVINDLKNYVRGRESTIKLFERWERVPTQKADEVVAICRSIGEILGKRWHLDRDKMSIIPNAFNPSSELLTIPIETDNSTITYLGRLEYRKGVYDLAKAIPMVLEARPNAKFRLVGKDQPANNQENFQEYIFRLSGKHADRVEFTGKVPLNSIPSILAQTDICVFPSIWENFPYVCLEAMAAGRGVIGSSAGGMKDMLQDGKAGILVKPNAPHEIANAIIKLMDNPSQRMQFGKLARIRVLQEYNTEVVGKLQVESYLRAISRRNNKRS